MIVLPLFLIFVCYLCYRVPSCSYFLSCYHDCRCHLPFILTPPSPPCSHQQRRRRLLRLSRRTARSSPGRCSSTLRTRSAGTPSRYVWGHRSPRGRAGRGGSGGGGGAGFERMWCEQELVAEVLRFCPSDLGLCGVDAERYLFRPIENTFQ